MVDRILCLNYRFSIKTKRFEKQKKNGLSYDVLIFIYVCKNLNQKYAYGTLYNNMV